MLSVPWNVLVPTNFELTEVVLDALPGEEVLDPELEAVKEHVGVFVTKHGDVAWKARAEAVDRRTNIPAPSQPPISRAYYKMVEIIKTCIICPSGESLHLCEAPGGFAQAVIEQCSRIRCVHVASRRGETFPNFARALLHYDKASIVNVGDDDMMSSATRDGFASEFGPRFELITADGAFDMQHDPARMESACAYLIACEIETAMRCQADGGTFVLKVFSLAKEITLQLVALLASCYESVHIVKPYTSRAVNDERYIVCENFFNRSLADNFRVPSNSDGLYLRTIASVDAKWSEDTCSIAKRMCTQQRHALREALNNTLKSATLRPDAPRQGGRGRNGQTCGPERYGRGRGRLAFRKSE